jgi:dihydroorotase
METVTIAQKLKEFETNFRGSKFYKIEIINNSIKIKTKATIIEINIDKIKSVISSIAGDTLINFNNSGYIYKYKIEMEE